MNTFYKLLGVALLATTTNNFVWFALTYWAYLSTRSVVSTSIVAGVWLIATALSSIWFGSIVDHHPKKRALLGSSLASLAFFAAGLAVLKAHPPAAFESVASPAFWLIVLVLLGGTVAGAIYSIAIPTLVAIVVPEDRRDKANGMFGTVMGVSFAITSVASGFALAYGGMSFVLAAATFGTLLALGALAFIRVDEKPIPRETDGAPKRIDLKGTIAAVRAIPGLFALIFFTTFNNFLGGVFTALMDAYGLSLVTVQEWGLLWGVLSFGFIFGGLYIAKKGLGSDPLRTLFRINIVMWIVCIVFTMQPSILLLAEGMLIWMVLVPFVEATEQTVFQRVVPVERLGRVFGLAHAIEQAASPVTALMIGPLAQFVFIPFMTTGKGVELIGGWFGTGVGRGLALVFIVAGAVGLAVTLWAMRSKWYRLLSDRYRAPADAPRA